MSNDSRAVLYIFFFLQFDGRAVLYRFIDFFGGAIWWPSRFIEIVFFGITCTVSNYRLITPFYRLKRVVQPCRFIEHWGCVVLVCDVFWGPLFQIIDHWGGPPPQNIAIERQVGPPPSKVSDIYTSLYHTMAFSLAFFLMVGWFVYCCPCFVFLLFFAKFSGAQGLTETVGRHNRRLLHR